jgi:hypothetical protein
VWVFVQVMGMAHLEPGLGRTRRIKRLISSFSPLSS